MIFIFSRRHRKALDNGQLEVNLSIPLRVSLWQIITSYNKTWGETSETGWNYYMSDVDVAVKELKKHWGRSFTGTNEKLEISFEGVLNNGSAVDVLDSIEVLLLLSHQGG